MISNHYNFTVNNKKIRIREISFTEYKTLNKKLLSDDIKDISLVFNEVIDQCVYGAKLNCLEKLYCIILIRNLTLGTDFNFMYDSKTVNMNMNILLEKFNFNLPDIQVDHDSVSYWFNLPSNFYNISVDDFIVDSLSKIQINGKEILCDEFSFDEKRLLLGKLNLPIFETFKKIEEQLSSLDITLLSEIKIKIYDGSFLFFIKRCFQDDMNGLYQFEYNCIKKLNLGAIDMDRYTYAELKIFLQHLLKEYNDKQAESNQMKVE